MSSFLDDDQPVQPEAITPQQRQPPYEPQYFATPSAEQVRLQQQAAKAAASKRWVFLVGIGCFAVMLFLALVVAGAAWFYLMPSPSPISEASRSAHARKGNVIGDLLIEGARQVRAGKLKSLAEFQEWKLGEQAKGGAAYNAEKNIYEETMRPVLESVNAPAGQQSLDSLATTLQELGEGYKQ